MVQRDGVGMDDCITIRLCCQRGVREQRKTEGQPNGLTLRQRDSETVDSAVGSFRRPSPELIGPGPENQALLHNGSGIAGAGLLGTQDGLSLSGTASAEGELIRAHARITLCTTMDRRLFADLAHMAATPLTRRPVTRTAQLPQKPN